MGAAGFPAGLSLESHKQAAMSRPLSVVPPPAQAVLAVDQGSGHVAIPCVEPGARVRVGSAVAVDADTGRRVLHATVSGSVRAVESRPTGSATGHGTCIVIDNDGTDALDPELTPLEDLDRLAPGDLVTRLADSGIVGLGGAGFNTAAKLAAALAGGAAHLVLNGAECEPWICCDDALMRDRPAQVVRGASLLMRGSGAGRCTIAIEEDKPEAIAAMQAALAAQPDERISIHVVPAAYPAGAERQLLATITGVEVPTGRVPSDVGLLCQNVGTAAAVADFAATGIPCIRRIVTVTGSGVTQPGNVEARIGTPVAELVAHRGGYAEPPERLLAGGTLTGRALADDAIGLAKTMNCVLAATSRDLASHRTVMPCIRCGDCARACPAGLLPQELHRWLGAGDDSQLERYGLDDCIECGCCDYVCPSQIPLTHAFRLAREARRQDSEEARRAADARRRYERHQARMQAAADAERRSFDDARRRARGDGPV